MPDLESMHLHSIATNWIIINRLAKPYTVLQHLIGVADLVQVKCVIIHNDIKHGANLCTYSQTYSSAGSNTSNDLIM